MDYFYAFLSLLAGVGAFLMGVKAMSDNTEKLANSKIKGLFNKTSKSKLVGVGIGALTTAIIQSSGVTTVMVVGLVNAGIMTLFQATTIIMGANIGTTITAQIAALQSFNFITFAMAFTFIGIFMNMLCKKEKLKTIGYALAGLGLVFVGLDFMSSSMELIKDSPFITEAFNKITNPFLLLFLGVILTALTQSSSAITSILITMVGAGIVIGGGGNSVLYIVLGTNIGSCCTALISSIGANANAKRASLIHLMFNVFGSVIFFILLISWRSFMDMTFGKWFSYPGTQIAMFHTAFNVTCTMIFLPFTKVFVKLSEKIIKSKAGYVAPDTFLDKRILQTPGIAIDVLTKRTLTMLKMSVNSVKIALEGFVGKNQENIPKVLENNERINNYGKEVTKYLIMVSSSGIGEKDEKYVSALHHNNGDILRISELADNITKYTMREIKDDLIFSDYVKGELDKMYALIEELSLITENFILSKNFTLISKIDEKEEKIDLMRRQLINDHIVRLNNGECRAENSSVFINLVSNLERIGDHINYIGHAIVDL